MDEPELDVTVVLPVYNERDHVITEVQRIAAALESSSYSFEIIVVDDGSSDGSSEQLTAVGNIRLIRFPENRGTGTARVAGTRAARGRVVVWTDSDMTYPNEEIPRLVKELDGYDQVVGARTSEQGTVKALRVPAKWLIRKLASYLSGKRIPDLNSGLRAFRREVALPLLYLVPAGFSCVTTMTMSFLSNGYSVKFVPIEYSKREGQSKFHWWTDTRRYVQQVIRMILLYNPLKVFMPVGVTLLGLGGAKLVWDVVDKDFRVGTNTLLVLFSALFVISIGLLSDLIVQVTKPRQQKDPASY